MNAIDKLSKLRERMSDDYAAEFWAEDLQDIIDDLRPVLMELENPWRPIETAPRDGTEVLVCQKVNGLDGGYQSVASFWVKQWVFCYQSNINNIKTPILLCFEPTHWMPLPTPPTCKESLQVQTESEGV